MKVGGTAIASVTQRHEVEPRRTPVSHAELRGAIAHALERTDGKRPEGKLVDVLTAQASLETANGERMYNFNFGGIKGHAPDGATAVCRTKEVVGGHEVAIRDGFRAYRTIDEGALDYVRTMKQRFGGALAPAARGDVVAFARELKKAGYYTAAEADYARGLERLMGGVTRSSPATTATPSLMSAGAPLTSAGLARLESSLDQGMFSAFSARPRHASEDEEDE